MSILRYVWPEGDTTPYRIIQKPQGEAWGAFKIIGSQIFPMGDFDDGRPNLNEPNRAYRTSKGWRIFYTGRVNPHFDSMLDTMVNDGCDKIYADIAKRRRYYASRLEPKYADPTLGESSAITRFVEEQGTRNSAWDEFIEIHDNWTGAHNNAEVLI